MNTGKHIHDRKSLILAAAMSLAIVTAVGTAHAQQAVEDVFLIDTMKEVQGHIGTYLARTFDVNPGDIHFDSSIDFATRQVTFTTSPGQWYGDRPLWLNVQISQSGNAWTVQVNGQAGDRALLGSGQVVRESITPTSASYHTDLAISPGGGPGSGGGPGDPDDHKWNDSHSYVELMTSGPDWTWYSLTYMEYTFNDVVVSEVYQGFDTYFQEGAMSPWRWTLKRFQVGLIEASVNTSGSTSDITGQGHFTMHIDYPICLRHPRFR